MLRKSFCAYTLLLTVMTTSICLKDNEQENQQRKDGMFANTSVTPLMTYTSQQDDKNHTFHDIEHQGLASETSEITIPGIVRAFLNLSRVRSQSHFNYGEESFKCPQSYGHFPDPEGNCSSYYACHNAIATRQTCSPPFLHFNPFTRNCDHQSEAECDYQCEAVGRFPLLGDCTKYVECTETMTRKFTKCSDGQHFNAITQQCDTVSRASCEVACPNYDTFLPLPGRCRLYVECIEGEAMTKMCPYGLHFNPIELTCDHPQNAKCSVQCYDTNGFFPIIGQCSTYVKCTDHQPKVMTCPSNLHFNFLLQACDEPEHVQCNFQCKEPTGYFPYPGVCILYYKCVNGIAMLQQCPRDTAFNDAVGQCDVLPNDHCLPKCLQEYGIFPVFRYPNIYMLCTRGKPVLKRCPRHLSFNAVLKQCEQADESKYKHKCPAPNGLYSVQGKCHMFLHCINDVPTMFPCPVGLHFNAYTMTCDWPDAAHCDMTECAMLDGLYPLLGDCKHYLQCKSGRGLMKTCNDGTSFDYKERQCKPNGDCAPKCEEPYGLFPLLGNCHAYLYCEEWISYIRYCPHGLMFDRVKTACDFPVNVIC